MLNCYQFVDGNDCAVNGKIMGYFHCSSFEAENFSVHLCSACDGSQIDAVKMWGILVNSVLCVV